jgi:HKD family nuclease
LCKTFSFGCHFKIKGSKLVICLTEGDKKHSKLQATIATGLIKNREEIKKYKNL